MNQPTQQQIPVDLKNAQDIECEECKGQYFSPVFSIKKISALISPTGQEMMIPVQTFQCSSCGHVNEDFSP